MNEEARPMTKKIAITFFGIFAILMILLIWVLSDFGTMPGSWDNLIPECHIDGDWAMSAEWYCD